jgi:hypothetical protein
MEVNAENLAGLSGYLEQTLKPEVHIRKPAEEFLQNVEKQVRLYLRFNGRRNLSKFKSG